ncbi:hypothetical protein F183_A51620 [Bryobacterales bacterium F-183]|nr:hypothetical protein F183_A51620 [Bryobacterales bacterium F-183]
MDQKLRALHRTGTFALLFALVACHSQPAVFDTRSDNTFGDAAAGLRLFLEARKDIPSGQQQHFCVVGTSEGDAKRAWVHWKEGNMLILWEPGDEYQIARSRRKLDLMKDVVGTEADLNGSTYLVTRQWADTITTACTHTGALYTVEKP